MTACTCCARRPSVHQRQHEKHAGEPLHPTPSHAVRRPRAVRRKRENVRRGSRQGTGADEAMGDSQGRSCASSEERCPAAARRSPAQLVSRHNGGMSAASRSRKVPPLLGDRTSRALRPSSHEGCKSGSVSRRFQCERYVTTQSMYYSSAGAVVAMQREWSTIMSLSVA